MEHPWGRFESVCVVSFLNHQNFGIPDFAGGQAAWFRHGADQGGTSGERGRF